MRTFIALEPPADLRAAIGELSGALDDLMPGMKWVKAANIHLTLRFLGEIETARLEDASVAVAGAAAAISSFDLRPTGLGHFGSPRKPRVVWLGLAHIDNLTELAAGIEERLEESGFGRADKPFSAHLTLARAGRRPGPPPDWERTRAAASPDWPAWTVSEVCVIKSTLTPRGPIYDIISRHELSANP